MIRSVALVYNIPDLPSNFTLVLSRSAIANIFAGNITVWNDTTLQTLNPGVVLPAQPIVLPAQPIVLVVRKDSSGTSQIMTSALSSFSPAWASTYGVFTDPDNWPVFAYKGETSTGVSGIVSSIPNSFGYLDQDRAVQDGLPYAAIINKAGNAVLPSVSSVQAAVLDHQDSFTNLTRFTATIADGSGAGEYPLVAFSYYIVHQILQNNCTLKAEMLRYFYWLLNDPVNKSSPHSNPIVPVLNSVSILISFSL